MKKALRDLSLSALLLGSAALAACSGSPASAARIAAPALADRLTLQMQQVQDQRPVAGVYTAHDLVDARARTSGTLVSLAVKAGDAVRRGQVLAVVRDERLNLQASAANAQAAAATAEAVRAEAELQRTRDLYANGVYAKARLEQVEAIAQVARGQARAAQAQHAAGAEIAAQGAVLAPADGLVLQAALPVGTVVAPGQAVVQVTAGPRVIRLQLPDAAAAQLKLGQMLKCRSEDGGWVQCGPVRQIYPVTNGGQVQVDIDGGQTRRFIGQRVEILAPLTVRTALQLPRRFVTTRYGVDTVQMLRPDGSVASVVVQLAQSVIDDQVELLTGAKSGDTVVILGVKP